MSIVSSHCLSLKRLSCERNGVDLFDELDHEFKSGELIHIAGANGSGKTTLLKTISGLRPIDNGDVCWDHVSIHNSKCYFEEMAYMGHKNALKEELTVYENMVLYSRLMKIKATQESIFRALNQVKLLDQAEQASHKLSFGQKRRLGFARLLLKKKVLWVLDEPFTGIDLQGRQLLETCFIQHLNQGGLIILSHHGSLASTSLEKYERKVTLCAL